MMKNEELGRLVRTMAQAIAGKNAADATDHRVAVHVLHAMNDAGYHVLTADAFDRMRGRIRAFAMAGRAST